jgi:hypothetical protein
MQLQTDVVISDVEAPLAAFLKLFVDYHFVMMVAATTCNSFISRTDRLDVNAAAAALH